MKIDQFRIIFILISMMLFGILSDAAEMEKSAQENPKSEKSSGAPRALRCPHCGVWTVSHSEPSALVGENIVVDEKTVLIPSCGELNVDSVRTSMTVNSDGWRTYKVSLLLDPYFADFFCKIKSDKNLRLEMEVKAAYGIAHDGEGAVFHLFKPGQGKEFLMARGWNSERGGPCSSGGGSGTSICREIKNAHLYRLLSSEVYRAYDVFVMFRSRPLRRSFNTAQFTRATMEFCSKRESDSGGGEWPNYWAEACQAHRLESKLQEFYAWEACVRANKSACTFPSEQFSRADVDPE